MDDTNTFHVLARHWRRKRDIMSCDTQQILNLVTIDVCGEFTNKKFNPLWRYQKSLQDTLWLASQQFANKGRQEKIIIAIYRDDLNLMQMGDIAGIAWQPSTQPQEFVDVINQLKEDGCIGDVYQPNAYASVVTDSAVAQRVLGMYLQKRYPGGDIPHCHCGELPHHMLVQALDEPARA